MRIALVEDDTDTHEFLTPFLEAHGYHVDSAYNGLEGLSLIKQHGPDLIVLDVILPDMKGWEVCQQVRVVSSIPIIMISAIATTDTDLIQALEIGADDYLVKPIRPHVLLARIRALLRRSLYLDWRDAPQVYLDGHLVVDLNRQQVRVQGKPITLSFLEYRLLELLVRNSGRTVPTLEIIEELWSETMGPDYARYVRIYITRLRAALEPDPHKPRYIVNDRGLGYRFDPQV